MKTDVNESHPLSGRFTIRELREGEVCQLSDRAEEAPLFPFHTEPEPDSWDLLFINIVERTLVDTFN